MEYNFSLPLLSDYSVSAFTSSTFSLMSHDERERFRVVVDNAGRRSAQAQDLKQPITSLGKLVHSDHVLYICCEKITARKSVIVGIIKTGKKKLFIYHDSPVLYEIEPVCILDFYVHESYQRKGYGKKLFEHVLKHERVKPENLAYDRPSPKFLAFLSKHYRLSNYIPQRNNFVVFRRYFSSHSGEATTSPNVCKVSKSGDPWTPISQRPLTAKRKMFRRDLNSNNSNLSPNAHRTESKSKAQAFHRSENFVNFKEKPRNPFAYSGFDSNPYQENAASRVKTSSSTKWITQQANNHNHKQQGGRKPYGNSVSERVVSFNLRNDNINMQENNNSPLGRNSTAKFGRRSGKSPKLAERIPKNGQADEFHSLNNVLQHRNFSQSFPFQQQSQHDKIKINYSRKTGMKHMRGQGAAACLVW